MEYRHIAYSITTGEVLSSSSSKRLNKMVKAAGYTGWVFSHHALEKKL